MFTARRRDEEKMNLACNRTRDHHKILQAIEGESEVRQFRLLRPARLAHAVVASCLCLSGEAMAQTLPLLNAPPIHLGDDESRVRATLGVKSALYPTPFVAGRMTLKAGDGLFVDFMRGRVVEIDVVNKSAGIRLGTITLGSDLATVRSSLNSSANSSGDRIAYTASGGEVVELRFGANDHLVDVIALIGDKTHLPQESKVSNVVLRNSGK